MDRLINGFLHGFICIITYIIFNICNDKKKYYNKVHFDVMTTLFTYGFIFGFILNINLTTYECLTYRTFPECYFK